MWSAFEDKGSNGTYSIAPGAFASTGNVLYRYVSGARDTLYQESCGMTLPTDDLSKTPGVSPDATQVPIMGNLPYFGSSVLLGT
jgi:hypothetical protein